MARTFDGTDDQVAFGSESAIDNISTFTACAFVRPTANIVDERQVLDKMDSSYVGNIFIGAVGGGGSNNKVFTYRQATGGDPSATSVADILVVNTWKVIIVTFDSGITVDSQRIYHSTIGGTIAEVGYSSGGPSVAWSGTLEADAGATLRVAARDPGDATFFAGGLAECAIWNRILTADERGALGKGYAPAFFPNGRVFYSPIDGRSSPEFNYAGTTHGTVTGTTYLEHPPVIYPSRMAITKTGASASSFKAAWARGSNVLIGIGAR